MKRTGGTLDAWLTAKCPKQDTCGSSSNVTDTSSSSQAAAPSVSRVVPGVVAPPKKKGKRFNQVVAGRTAVPKPVFELKFRNFLNDETASVGDSCFEYLRQETPLARKGHALRGAIVEEVVKCFYATSLKLTVVDAKAGDRVNGAKRGKGTERYDFGVKRDGDTDARVEVKNARMVFVPSLQSWKLQFQNVKAVEHDDLVLCFEGFDGLRLYEWKGANASTSGKSTEARGNHIVVCASRSQPDPVAAHAQLVAKMDERNELLAYIPYDDAAYTDLWSMTTRTETVYDTVPMCELSVTARGKILENVTRLFLEHCMNDIVEDAPASTRVNGAACSKNTTTCDFLVDNDRSEFKSSLMIWVKSREGYELKFEGVKPELHDKLLLAWLTPRGVHLFEHDGKSGLSTNGKETESNGSKIQMYSPKGKKGYRVASAAERFLLKNFNSWGPANKYLAFFAFQDGDADLVLNYGKKVGGAGEGGGDEEGDEGEYESASE